jgi:hypothetical protein
VLSNKNLDKDEVFIGTQKRKHQHTPVGFWPNSKGIGVEVQKQGQIHYFRKRFGGFLRSLEGEKGPQVLNPKKKIHSTFYLLIN